MIRGRVQSDRKLVTLFYETEPPLNIRETSPGLFKTLDDKVLIGKMTTFKELFEVIK